MIEKNRPWKWALVAGLTGLAILAVWPPSQQLKGGIDLVGGTSLLYEIDTTGMRKQEQGDLAERVMEVLKRRVDPNGQLNLVWRPIGKTRLEIQMPRPPKDVLERRQAYNEKIAAVQEKHINRIDIELALHASEMDKLVRGVSERAPKLEALKTAYEAYRATQTKAMQDADLAVELEAEKAYQAAMMDAESTVLPVGRLEDALALPAGKEREKELADLHTMYPSYATLIDEAREQYDVWSQNKGSLEDPADLKRRIRGAGVLEFRILAERDQSNPAFTTAANNDPNMRQEISKYVEDLRQRGPRGSGKEYRWFPIEKVQAFMFAMRDRDLSEFDAVKDSSTEIVERYAGKYYVLMHDTKDYGLLHTRSSKWKLVRAYGYFDPNRGRPAVDFQLNSLGGGMFGELTRKNKQRQLAILLDGVAMSHATIISQINERGQITGDFTQERVDELVTTLEAGSLPARLKETPLMEYTIGPALGKYNRDQGMEAAVYGFVAVAVFMLIYYMFAGLVANVALMLNLLFTLAIMATLQATFTLPGIAGMILTVGMAVDANVLILERFREERQRGLGLIKALRLGYDRALSTIVDANITTLITCVILGYVGSEEVKGFAITLGLGVATSMFTALFVTRLVFTTLIDAKLLKNLPMLRLIGQPKIDWLKLRGVFWPVSMVIVLAGGAFFVDETICNKEALYDIEFLGGTSVQIELKPGAELSDEDAIRQKLISTDEDSASGWLKAASERLAAAKITAASQPDTFHISAKGLTPEQIGAMLRTTYESSLARNGVSGSGGVTIVETKPELEIDLAAFTAAVQGGDKNKSMSVVAYVKRASDNLATTKVQMVGVLGEEVAAKADEKSANAPSHAYELVTVETAKDLVQTAIMAVMGDQLVVERSIKFATVTNPDTGKDFFPIGEAVTELDDIGKWSEAVGETAGFGVQRFKGGVAMVFAGLEPAQTTEGLKRRIREIRLLPEFEDFQWREYDVFGLGAAETVGGESHYRKVAIVAVDPNVPCYEDLQKWEETLAAPELEQAALALGSEKSLRKVVQFSPTVAQTAKTKAVQAIVLALLAIVAYIWFRFGNMQFGLAAIVALVHDVSVPLGLMTLLDVMGVGDLRISMPVIAAFLAIIGYSLNDTIVVFDRIRENRGKLNRLSAEMINQSINQTLARTLLTSATTFLAVFIMLLWGGPGMYGFAFAMTIGVLSGTYSSLAIAVPLVYRPKVLHVVVYVLAALALFAAFVVSLESMATLGVVGAIIAVLLAVAIIREIGADRSALNPAAA